VLDRTKRLRIRNGCRPAKLLTALGNARRFIEQHGENLRYCRQWAKWLVWDGTRWKSDVTGEVFGLAKETVETIWDEAKTKTTEVDQKRYFQCARASQSEGKIRAMMSLATSKPLVVVEPHQLDADQWLLNCAKRSLELAQRRIRAPRARTSLH